VLRATRGTSVEEMTPPSAHAPRRGHHRVAAEERRPVMIAAQAHLDPRGSSGSRTCARRQYESILAVPILAARKLRER
jgi:hypothetical protein